jgi:23S rRNA (adenine2503-C2)-methyltransferase
MKDLSSLQLSELQEYIASLDEPAYRAKQIYGWIMKGVGFDGMSNVPKKLIEKITDNGGYIRTANIKKKFVSKDGTIKYLMELFDGELIESVIMSYKHGYTICISTEAGCPMGCAFCASTLGGLKRRLYPSEMLSQIAQAQLDINNRVDGIVLMGIGEPLDNYDNVIKFLKIVGSPDSFNIGYRHISLSTCGVVDKIYDLAKEDLPITLSISLHASTDEQRSAMMPINKRWNIEQLLTACSDYFKTTGRRISFEYSLASGKNDSPNDAHKLISVLKKYCKDMPLHVNLIPINATGRGFSSPEKDNIYTFASILNNAHITATVRRTLGSDINASCGQLRSGEKK